MTGISHKQAIRFIDSGLDGLLSGDQARLLDEHLQSCASCQAYAAEIGRLPTSLQSEFHDRWDKQSGPSERVFEQVTAKARRISSMNRLSSGARLVAGMAGLLVLGFLINFVTSQLRDTSEAAIDRGTTSSPPLVDNELAANRLLAFVSGQSGNSDIYIMHADGTGLTNLTNDPANDSDPFWSPDGKRIAFMSDRGGSTQIYLMDADGSNLVQLTNAEGGSSFDGTSYNPWSPDGRKLIILHEQRLYVLDITDKSLTTLTAEPGQYLLTSW
jgi:hypothetical protein